MRFVALAAACLLVSSIGPASAADAVLLASSRSGSIEAINPDTMQLVARIQTPSMTESVAADPAGQRLFVAAPRSPGQACCALYALDPQSMQLSFLIWPALSTTVTAERLFTQRGNIGIEAFDLQSLNHLPTVKAHAIYQLRPSPDGRLMFGVTHGPRPSVDLFDTVQGALIASHPLPGASSIAGTWLGQQYFLFTVEAGQAKLRPVAADQTELGQGVALSPSGAFADCEPAPHDVVAAGNKLAIYAQFGLPSDGHCGVRGGFVTADPTTGIVSDRFAGNLHFRQMAAGSDGRYLYGLDVDSPQIVKLDAATGQVLMSKSLDKGVWYLTSGSLPQAMQGRLNLAATIR